MRKWFRARDTQGGEPRGMKSHITRIQRVAAEDVGKEMAGFEIVVRGNEGEVEGGRTLCHGAGPVDSFVPPRSYVDAFVAFRGLPGWFGVEVVVESKPFKRDLLESDIEALNEGELPGEEVVQSFAGFGGSVDIIDDIGVE
jgi:hypothetical protein